MTSRRRFVSITAAAPLLAQAASSEMPQPPHARISLDGHWQFRIDGSDQWREVVVPHTWQIEPEQAEYRGAAWYRRTFYAPQSWADAAVRVEFEAVFHTATVWLNGMETGRHIGKGYTAFTVDLSPHLVLARQNLLAVRVDNSFNDSMLPRGRSSDWAHDGGIYRPVWLLVTPKVFLERIEIDAEPDFDSGQARVYARAIVRNSSSSG